MWRISLLSLALFVVTPKGVAYPRASPTVFHTGGSVKLEQISLGLNR
jgi:hypothetical protein